MGRSYNIDAYFIICRVGAERSEAPASGTKNDNYNFAWEFVLNVNVVIFINFINFTFPIIFEFSKKLIWPFSAPIHF